jgi:starch phosphorylase
MMKNFEDDMTTQRTIAYFSMEIALEARMPTYSGGLGVLAGDTIRSAADLKVPMVAVTLLHRKGYFHQRLDASDRQSEEPAAWAVENFLKEMSQRVSVTIEGRAVHLRAWQYDVIGNLGYKVPRALPDGRLAKTDAAWEKITTGQKMPPRFTTN